jgi:ribulose-phosphate 3-epimerase
MDKAPRGPGSAHFPRVTGRIVEKIAPSILAADFSCLSEELKAVEQGGADLIHVDVMDGHFVPNITIGPFIVKAIRKLTALPLDTHLMIENPERYAEAFAETGTNGISFHAEVCSRLKRTIGKLRGLGVSPGVVLNPSTRLNVLFPVLDQIDLVLLMSVNPGFGGQAFIPSVLKKIEKLRQMIDRENYPVEIEVDGGIKVDNIGDVARAGADIFVLGTGIFKAKNYKATIGRLRKEIAKHKA